MGKKGAGKKGAGKGSHKPVVPPNNHESGVDKDKTTRRLQIVRLERLVEREASELRNYFPPAEPEPGAEDAPRKKKRRSTPEDWKLRGAARPWVEIEALNAPPVAPPRGASCRPRPPSRARLNIPRSPCPPPPSKTQATT